MTGEVSPEAGAATPLEAPMEARGSRWQRAAVMAAIIWLAAGAGLSALASSAPHPKAAIPQLLVLGVWIVGWPIVRAAGRRYGVTRRSDWLKTWALTIGLIWLGLGLVGCVAAIAMYG